MIFTLITGTLLSASFSSTITSTDRVSFHRYTFPAGEKSHILFDIGNKQGKSCEVENARMNPESEAKEMEFDEAKELAHKNWNAYQYSFYVPHKPE